MSLSQGKFYYVVVLDKSPQGGQVYGLYFLKDQDPFEWLKIRDSGIITFMKELTREEYEAYVGPGSAGPMEPIERKRVNRIRRGGYRRWICSRLNRRTSTR